MSPDTSSFLVPDVVVSHFHIKDGDVVADFGSGSGHFLHSLALRVGTGKVYACEIQKSLVEKISTYVHAQQLLNVYPLWCDLEEPNGLKIATDSVDVGILVNTLFQIEDKEMAIKEMSRTIHMGGRLIVIDWTDSFAGLGPMADHVVTAADATALCESLGFVLEQEFPAGGHHYGLVFRKI
jgi:ubiquinone/menaquinone biosynthesis C-methylase UbiE